jgi:hypothetical protein
MRASTGDFMQFWYTFHAKEGTVIRSPRLKPKLMMIVGIQPRRHCRRDRGGCCESRLACAADLAIVRGRTAYVGDVNAPSLPFISFEIVGASRTKKVLPATAAGWQKLR